MPKVKIAIASVPANVPREKISAHTSAMISVGTVLIRASMNLIMLTTVRLCIMLLEASTAKGSARAQPMTVPNIDIFIVSTSGDTTFPKKLHLGWKIFPRITKSSFILENTVAKLTIPAPAQFLEQMIMPFAWGNTKKFYDTPEQVADDIAAGYKEFIKDVYAAGCRNLQFDDCSWGMVVDPSACKLFGTTPAGLEKIKNTLLDINNKAIEGKPEDLVINTHVCRGNFHSTYASSGAYTSVASTLFAKENVNAYYLEYDDERSGGFEPLKNVTGDKKVVLGLITTKSPELEDEQTVIDRINEAAKYIPLDRLCLSPQCGFASCEIGNKLTEEEQWAKLRLVKKIAEKVWG